MPDRIVSYPAAATDWPDEESAHRGMQMIRLWRFTGWHFQPVTGPPRPAIATDLLRLLEVEDATRDDQRVASPPGSLITNRAGLLIWTEQRRAADRLGELCVRHRAIAHHDFLEQRVAEGPPP